MKGFYFCDGTISEHAPDYSSIKNLCMYDHFYILYDKLQPLHAETTEPKKMEVCASKNELDNMCIVLAPVRTFFFGGREKNHTKSKLEHVSKIFCQFDGADDILFDSFQNRNKKKKSVDFTGLYDDCLWSAGQKLTADGMRWGVESLVTCVGTRLANLSHKPLSRAIEK